MAAIRRWIRETPTTFRGIRRPRLRRALPTLQASGCLARRVVPTDQARKRAQTPRGPAARAPVAARNREDHSHASALARSWSRLGAGLITGASDDDPSGIATYSQAGGPVRR